MNLKKILGSQGTEKIIYFFLIVVHSLLPGVLADIFIVVLLDDFFFNRRLNEFQNLDLLILLINGFLLYVACKELSGKELARRILLTYGMFFQSLIPATIFGLVFGFISFILGVLHLFNLTFGKGLVFTGYSVVTSAVLIFAYTGKRFWPSIYEL